MEAALDLFVERGFHGAPTSLIARRAGVGVGTIYRYFPSKEDLVHSVYEEVHVRFHSRFGAETAGGAPLKARFTGLLGRLLGVFMESPRDFRFLEQYHYSPYAGSGQPEIPAGEQNALQRLLREGVESGVFREGPLPVLQAIVLGPVVALAKEHIAGRLTADEAAARFVLSSAWEAVLKRPRLSG